MPPSEAFIPSAGDDIVFVVKQYERSRVTSMGLPSSAQHDILVNARPSRVDVLVLPTAFCIDVVLFLVSLSCRLLEFESELEY